MHNMKSSQIAPGGRLMIEGEGIQRPLDVKLYKRDLEAAITLSFLKNEDKKRTNLQPVKEISRFKVPVVENTDPSSLHMSNCSLDEITSEKESPALSRQRKATTKGAEDKTLMDEDEDYEPKLTPDSESDEDFSEPAESEDEEFTVKKVSKTKKKDRVTENEKTKTPRASIKQPSKQRLAKSQAAAQVGGSPTEKSPGQGLRIGLPRLVRVKLLHLSVASH
ncbi:RAD51-associated protein 1-like [Perca flavescens]|uniref:RAD51-associated protein 1-like n=1 Tax=Perca flavescens TaxID=8167 RepID=UPI00106EE3FB|nr:RAD51-associated protein 1-like [Perca flavescens]